MKKILVLTLVLIVLAVMLISCTAKGSSVEECCEKVISTMREMTVDEGYDEYVRNNNAASRYEGALSKLRGGDYSKPKAIYEISIPKGEMLSVAIGIEGMSEELSDYLASSSYLSFASLINMNAGIEAVSVSTLYTAQNSFVCEQVKENTVYLYVYEKGYPIALMFSKGESGAVRLNGSFIINDNFNTEDATQIENFCKELGLKGVVAKKK